MNKRIISLITIVFFATLVNAQVKLWLVDPLEPVFPDSNNLSFYSNKYNLDFPLGTVADVHILLNLPAGEKFTVSASIKKKQLPFTCWSNLADVPVEQNTGLDSRTEQYKNKVNPYVIRRAPFRIYEAIVPLKNNEVEAKNNFTALRLSIPAAMFQQSKKYDILITAQGKGWKRQGIFTAQIHNAILPALKNSRFFYTNWFSLSQMEQKHGVVRWSEPWFVMLDKYAHLMAYGRQNCISIPAELITVKEGSIKLDEEKMLRFIEVFRKYGFGYFESPHLMYRGDNDNWGDPELKVYLTKKRYGTDDAKKDVDTITTLIKNFTQKNGFANSWLQHISDEPTGVQAKCYREVVKQVRSIYAEIKIMEATNDRDSLAGSVDLWCPTIDDFQENEKFFRSRQQLNEKVLVYTCLTPGGKWLNRLLDQERLRQVYFGWGAAHYNTFGFLHWGLNQYSANPWLQTVVHHPAPGAAANNFLPAGDTHIFYPGENGPLSSIRFEAHRTGIEDFELLDQLKKKNKKLIEVIINKIFRSYTDYDTSVKKYRDARQQLLKYSEQLN